jgi:hypothetical protein
MKDKIATEGFQRVYSSMTAAANDTKIPLKILKISKRKGCPAFKPNGAVFMEMFLPWYESHKDEIEGQAMGSADTEALLYHRTRLTKAQADREELELSKARGKYIEKKEVMRLIKSLAISQKAVLTATLLSELPNKLQGCNVPEIKVMLTTAVVRVMEIMHKFELPEDGVESNDEE